MPFDTLSLFFFASCALAFAPGPDNIFVLTQSALYGRKSGILVTLGLCTGLIFHTAAVSLGVAVIFQTSAMAFNVLKIVGALYLAYLAWGAFNTPAENLSLEENPISRKKLYLRGVIMNITNPKVAIFFLAFLPQFASPENGSIPMQIMILGGLFMLSTLLCFGTIAWFAGLLGEKLKTSSTAQQIMNKIAATVFAGLAIKLLVTEQS